MKLCVVADLNWGIGKDGDQPYHIPEDQRYFRTLTLGKTIVLGRVTLAAFPGGVPLPKRNNIVLSRDDIDVPGVKHCRSLEGLGKCLQKYNADDVFVVGGQQIYEMLLEYCDYAYVTKIFAKADADRFFPNLDKMPYWKLESQSEQKHHNGVEFCFCEYRNLQPKRLLGNL